VFAGLPSPIHLVVVAPRLVAVGTAVVVVVDTVADRTVVVADFVVGSFDSNHHRLQK
jgi:hypothetical protein